SRIWCARMIDVIAAMDGTFPQRCFQSSSARAMGSNERLSGFGTVQTLPAGHMLVSSVSPFGHPRPDFRCLSDRSKPGTFRRTAFEQSLKRTGRPGGQHGAVRRDTREGRTGDALGAGAGAGPAPAVGPAV